MTDHEFTMPARGFTMEQRCEAIAKWQTARGNPLTADEVWNSVRGAELWEIFEWYEQAKSDGFPAVIA